MDHLCAARQGGNLLEERHPQVPDMPLVSPQVYARLILLVIQQHSYRIA
jgi:hypothetical protein